MQDGGEEAKEVNLERQATDNDELACSLLIDCLGNYR
jgi:hypothetical protein